MGHLLPRSADDLQEKSWQRLDAKGSRPGSIVFLVRCLYPTLDCYGLMMKPDLYLSEFWVLFILRKNFYGVSMIILIISRLNLSTLCMLFENILANILCPVRLRQHKLCLCKSVCEIKWIVFVSHRLYLNQMRSITKSSE